jgi:DNA mismatch repair ATPase MutL
MESLEVTDNGSGLDPSDYETLGMTLPKKLARM